MLELFFKRKIFLSGAVFLFLILYLFSSGLEARAPYESYTYNFWGREVQAPQAYIPENVYRASDIGVDSINNPRDIYVSHENKIYLLDTGNDRLLILNEDIELVKKIEQFEINGAVENFNSPRGVYVNENQKYIYVADTENARIVIFDIDGNYIDYIGTPETTADGVIPEDFRFRPLKIAVNPAGRIYVIARGVYDGIMEFSYDGQFMGFIGAPRVDPAPIDLFWRYVSTEEQRARRALFLPIEYSSIDIDEAGLLMATEAGPTGDESIKRINTAGTDSLARRGFHPPQGDLTDRILAYEGVELEEEAEGEDVVSSTLIDITTRENNRYSVLDSNRGRVFTYDNNGNLLYVFGGRGNIKGLSQRPSSLASLGTKMLVVDAAGYLTQYQPTEYGTLIHEAIDYYNLGYYEQSEEKWREIIRLNSNYDQAYSGIGLSYLRRDQYEQAMHNFRTGENRTNYSAAFMYYRRDVITENFSYILFLFFAVLIIMVFVFKYKIINKLGNWLLKAVGAKEVYEKAAAEQAEKLFTQINKKEKFFLKAKEVAGSLKYSLYVIFHPAGGFWDLKRDDRGKLTSAAIIFLIVSAVYIFLRQYTAFIFNERNLNELNIIVEFLSLFVPFILWCIVNWALTTLMEGKGTFNDIIIASSYSLVPLIIIYIPTTILSHFMTLEEGSFYYLLVTGGLIWALILLFMSTMVTHEYTLTKTLFTIILIIMGIVSVLFLLLLFVSVINQLFVFLYRLYLELSLR